MKYLSRISLFFLLAVLLCASAVPLPTSAMNGSKITIVLDPGHGGNDPGAVNGKTYERENALKIAEQMKTILEQNGNFKVYLTREDNKTGLSLYERAAFADSVNADLLVSLHFNSYSNSAWGGTEVCISVKDRYSKKELGAAISSGLSKALGTKDRGTLAQPDYGDRTYYWDFEANWDVPYNNGSGQPTDYYGVINGCSKFGIPAIIVEHCYISNTEEVELIRSEWGLKQMAKANAEAIIDYYTGHTHRFGAYETDYPTSCSFAGKQSKRCEICGVRKDTKALASAPDPDAHLLYTVNKTKASCSKEGKETCYCAIAKSLIANKVSKEEHIVEKVIPKTEHTFKLTNKRAPVHVTDGFEEYTCTKCWTVDKRTIPATEKHTYELIQTIPSTCKDAGKEIYKCTGCEDSYETLLPLSTEHEMEHGELIDPTCTENGRITSICNLCQHREERILEALGHDYSEENHTCIRCGEAAVVTTDPVTTAPPETVPMTTVADTDSPVTTAPKDTETPEQTGPIDTESSPQTLLPIEEEEGVPGWMITATIALCFFAIALSLWLISYYRKTHGKE